MKSVPTIQLMTISQEQANVINDWFNKNIETIAYLAGRWEDEKEYEDLVENGYEDAIKKTLPTGWTLKKIMPYPFGFVFTTGDSNQYAVVTTKKSIYWRQVG